MTGAVAVVDLGTISTRLLIVDAVDGANSTPKKRRETTVTRMGEGLNTDGRITEQAIARVVRCLEQYRALIDDAGVRQLRVVATSAARDAKNQSQLFEAVESVLGVVPDLLTGEEEGRLAFAGATSEVDHAGVVLVIDVGGGSTEFAIGTTWAGLDHVFSAETGAARVTDAFLLSDPPRADELSSALSVIELHIADVKRELPGLADALSSSGLIIGLGGTVSTMAAIELGLIHHDPGAINQFELTRVAAEDVFRTLATEAAADRRHNPGLPEDRVDLIVGGACVVVETMRQLDIDAIVVSESDLLDGVALELMQA